MCVIICLVPGLPDKPVNLNHRLLIREGRVHIVLRWEAAHSDSPVTSYRLVWSEMGKEKTAAFTIVLSKVPSPISINH